MNSPVKSTVTQKVYLALRASILGGDFLPNEKLRFVPLAESHGTSVGVIREALFKLTGEGFVVNKAQQGFRVMSLSQEDLNDLTHTRCVVESLVLEDSIRNGDLEWESRLVAAHHQLVRLNQADGDGISAEWSRAHHEFHVRLLAGSHQSRMKAFAASLRASAEIYRCWSYPFEDSVRDVEDEHLKMTQLAIDRRADECVALLREHLMTTQSLLIEGMESRAYYENSETA